MQQPQIGQVQAGGEEVPDGPARTRPEPSAHQARGGPGQAVARLLGPRRRSHRAASTGTPSAAAVYLVDAARPRATPRAQAGAWPSTCRTASRSTRAESASSSASGVAKRTEVHDPRRQGQQQRCDRARAQARLARRRDRAGRPRTPWRAPRGRVPRAADPTMAQAARAEALLERHHRDHQLERQRGVDVGVRQQPVRADHLRHDVGLLVGMEARRQTPADAGEGESEREERGGDDRAALGQGARGGLSPAAARGAARGPGGRCRGGSACRRNGSWRPPRRPVRVPPPGSPRAPSRRGPGRRRS